MHTEDAEDPAADFKGKEKEWPPDRETRIALTPGLSP